ncbi:MAG TPA: trans-aconitate methyltransferase, partial [Saccharofermentans sp.]|nr:trans-aconitate methyltransferase [Saccharofermentans sp.]
EAILDWYRGTGLRPYIQALGDDKESIQEFEKDILDRIVTAYPKQKDGNIIFDFPRLFFTAKVK